MPVCQVFCAPWELSPLLIQRSGQSDSSGTLPEPRGALPRGRVVSMEVGKHQEGSLGFPVCDACSSARTVWPMAVLCPVHILGLWKQRSPPQLARFSDASGLGKAAELMQLCGDPGVPLMLSFRSYLWPSVLWEHYPETDPSASTCLPSCSWLLTLTTLDICGLAWQLSLYPGWWLREQGEEKGFSLPCLALTAVLGV